MFDQFTQLVSDASGWPYAMIFLLAFFDAPAPLVPSDVTRRLLERRRPPRAATSRE